MLRCILSLLSILRRTILLKLEQNILDVVVYGVQTYCKDRVSIEAIVFLNLFFNLKKIK